MDEEENTDDKMVQSPKVKNDLNERKTLTQMEIDTQLEENID